MTCSSPTKQVWTQVVLLLLCSLHGKIEHSRTILTQSIYKGCDFFAYSWKFPACSGAFLLTVDTFSFFTYNWSFFAYNFSFLLAVGVFLLTVGKVRLIRPLRDCKQRNLTVNKKTPTASK